MLTFVFLILILILKGKNMENEMNQGLIIKVDEFGAFLVDKNNKKYNFGFDVWEGAEAPQKNDLVLFSLTEEVVTKVKFIKKRNSGEVVVKTNNERESVNLFVMNEFNLVAWSYLLVIFSPILAGFGFFIGLIMAFVLKSSAQDPLIKGHLGYLIKTCIISFILSIISIPFVFIFGIGFLLLVIVGIYLYYKTIRGLLLLIKRKPV